MQELPGPSTSSFASEIATSTDHRDVASKPVDFQRLHESLDLTSYIRQIEKLLAQPIKIPGTTLFPHPTSSHRGRQGIFSVRGVWPSEGVRRSKISKLFNFNHVKGRDWIKDLLLEESDSDDEAEPAFTQRDIRSILKMHRIRRKLQKQYHSENVHSQYSFFSAGLLSVQDSYQEPTAVRNRSCLKMAEPSPNCGSSTALLAPLPDDSNESLTVDSHYSTTTVIPLPPLSH